MRICPALVTACLAALPMIAPADPAADYARLAQALPQLAPGQEPVGYMTSALALAQTMQGRWLMTSFNLMAEEDGFPSAEKLQKYCDMLGMEAAPDGPLAFTLTTPTKGEPFRLRLTWAGGNSYLSTMDFAGALDRFFPGMKPEETPGGALLQMAQNGQGSVALLTAGEDLILMIPTSQPVQLLVRCPCPTQR